MSVLAPGAVLTVMARDALPSPFVNQGGDEAGPAGLVRGAEPHAGVAVEVFVEEDEVAPVWVGLKFFVPAVGGAAALCVAREEADEPFGEAARHLVELDRRLAGDGAVDCELVAVGFAQLAQGLDHHEGRGEPDGAAPVGVAALEPLPTFARLVADLRAAEAEGVPLVPL